MQLPVKHHASKSAGFTLLELLVVMIIMALIAGSVAPSLAGFAVGRQAKDAATIIVSLARYAQTQAVSEGRTYRLNIDVATRSIWLSAGHANTFAPLTNDLGKKFDIPTNVKLEATLPDHQDGTYIEFKSSGRLETGTVKLTDRFNNVTTVTCPSVTESYTILPSGASR